MNCENQVLSDVHAFLPSKTVCLNSTFLSESRFSFKMPKSLRRGKYGSSLTSESDSHLLPIPPDQVYNIKKDVQSTGKDILYKCDQDGDLIVQRASSNMRSSEYEVTVVHAMATDIDLVGQQVWLGSLLLCDFMMHYSALFEAAVVFDLGAGVGLTSIIAAIIAKTVFCTDHQDDILSVADHNVECNRHLLRRADVRVRKVDWRNQTITGNLNPSGPFCLTSDDVETLDGCSIILAAEVVYDLELTDMFFCFVYNLLVKDPAKIVYMTVEKRQVYTIADRDVVSPAYEHFRENLKDLCSIDEGPVRFLCSQIDVGFPQYFSYQRTKELELWKIETVFLSA